MSVRPCLGLGLTLALGCSQTFSPASDTAADSGSTPVIDDDGDGFPSAESGGSDCDDGDAQVNPAAVEVCNGIDDDCNGAVDDDDDPADPATFYRDGDGDGFGDAGVEVSACEPPSGYSTDATDCDDTDSAVFPGADELCNGRDDDCDDAVDEDDAVDAETWYADDDGDGYGDEDETTQACDAPSGYVAEAVSGFDCDDGDSDIWPGAVEYCNDADDDCDGETDEVGDGGAVDADTWYADTDGDGVGDEDSPLESCDQPAGYVDDSVGFDCDDDDRGVGAPQSLLDGVGADLDVIYTWDHDGVGRSNEVALATTGDFEDQAGAEGTWTFDECTGAIELSYDSGTTYSGDTDDWSTFEGTMASAAGLTGEWEATLDKGGL